jgi:hypothetical protein
VLEDFETVSETTSRRVAGECVPTIAILVKLMGTNEPHFAHDPSPKDHTPRHSHRQANQDSGPFINMLISYSVSCPKLSEQIYSTVKENTDENDDRYGNCGR